MFKVLKFALVCLSSLMALLAPVPLLAATEAVPPAGTASYVLGDSIAYGLHLSGLEAKLQEKLGGPSRISYDGGRSITSPGNQIKQTALQSIEADKAHIAKSGVIFIVLGMNPMEASFTASQQDLMKKLKAIAPNARYFWVDIGATVGSHVEIWNSRNKTIYDNAERLGYRVVSRYKAIFGPAANPLDITPGQNFPDWANEPGLSGPGNIHGYDLELSAALLLALTHPEGVPTKIPESIPARLNPADRPLRARCEKDLNLSSYVLGDSIVYGMHRDRLALKLTAMLGGPSRISFDTGRSIVTPGIQIKKTALESVEIDRAFIASAKVIIISFGTNQMEDSFVDSQRLLMQKLKALAPDARYYWIDIGATISTQAAGWSARNKVIYGNAASLGYTVISRYKVIFGPNADPLNITPGLVFPEMVSEPGYTGPGNVHGFYPELTEAVLDVLAGSTQMAAGATRPTAANCPAGY